MRPSPGKVVTGEVVSGRGRIIFYNSFRPQGFLFREAYETDSQFPFDMHANAWLARLCHYAAGAIERGFSACGVSGGRVSVSCAEGVGGTRLEWRLSAKDGTRCAQGVAPVRSGKAEIAPELNRGGRHLLSLRLLDGKGSVLDYCAVTLRKEGPRIDLLEDVRKYNTAAVPAEIRFRASGVRNGMKALWTLEDFSGRILERGEQEALPEGRFQVPLSALFTGFARLKMTLLENGALLDSARIPVYVQDRDRLRLLSDFTPCVWPPEGYLSREYADAVNLRLEEIGIRSLGFVLGDKSRALASGMGIASGAAVGGGARFIGWKQKSGIRAQAINTEEARREIAAQAEIAAERARLAGPVGYQICDEPGLCRKGEADELDSTPENLAEYRRRMKEKYGSVGHFNRTCGSSYSSFDELRPGLIARARAEGRFAEFIEWRNFNTDRWCEVFRLMSDSVKKKDPGARFSIPNTFGQGALGGNDYWRLLAKAGVDFSQEYTSMVYMGGMENPSPIHDFDEFYRSFAPGMRLWGYVGYVNTRSRLMFQPWWFAAHRYGGFTWFAAHGPSVRSDGLRAAWNLVDVPGNGLTADAAHLKDALNGSGLLDGMGRLFLEYDWAPRKIAVYYSHNSMLVNFCLGSETREGEIGKSGPLHDYFHSRHCLRYLLEEMLYQYDFVAPEQVEKGLLSSFQVLFLPGISALSDRETAALKRFLRAGGTIVADSPPGLYDELGRKRSSAPLEGIRGVHLTGRPFDDRDAGLRGKIRSLLDSAGVSPVLESDRSAPVAGREAMHFRNGIMNVFVILRNPVRADRSGVQKLRFPCEGHVYDLLLGKYLGRGREAQALLTEERPAAVFGVYPYRVKRLSFTLPGRIRAGSDLAAEIAAEPDSGSPGRHLFHAELVFPGRRTRHHMKRNLPAENGALAFRFRMAFNDPKGRWILRVKDVMTGMTREKSFILE